MDWIGLLLDWIDYVDWIDCFDWLLIFIMGIFIYFLFIGIHHKTSKGGGAYGWPDATYLSRVTEELAVVGVTSD